MCERASPREHVYPFFVQSSKVWPCVSAPCTARSSSSQGEDKRKIVHYSHYIPRAHHLSAYFAQCFIWRLPTVEASTLLGRLEARGTSPSFSAQFFGSYLLLHNPYIKPFLFLVPLPLQLFALFNFICQLRGFLFTTFHMEKTWCNR